MECEDAANFCEISLVLPPYLQLSSGRAGSRPNRWSKRSELRRSAACERLSSPAELLLPASETHIVSGSFWFKQGSYRQLQQLLRRPREWQTDACQWGRSAPKAGQSRGVGLLTSGWPVVNKHALCCNFEITRACNAGKQAYREAVATSPSTAGSTGRA